MTKQKYSEEGKKQIYQYGKSYLESLGIYDIDAIGKTYLKGPLGKIIKRKAKEEFVFLRIKDLRMNER